MFSHLALISVEMANSFWPRKLSAAPISVFLKRETLFAALVEHFVLRLQVAHEEEAVGFPVACSYNWCWSFGSSALSSSMTASCADEPQLLGAHPGADLHVTASDEERVAVGLVELRAIGVVVDYYQDLVQFLHLQLLGPLRDLALLLDDAVPLVPVGLLALRVHPQILLDVLLDGIQPSSMLTLGILSKTPRYCSRIRLISATVLPDFEGPRKMPVHGTRGTTASDWCTRSWGRA